MTVGVVWLIRLELLTVLDGVVVHVADDIVHLAERKYQFW